MHIEIKRVFSVFILWTLMKVENGSCKPMHTGIFEPATEANVRTTTSEPTTTTPTSLHSNTTKNQSNSAGTTNAMNVTAIMASLPVGDNLNTIEPDVVISLSSKMVGDKLVKSPVIPSSTENMSAETTTLSADEFTISQFQTLKRRTDNLRLVTDSLFNTMKSSEESTYYLASLSDYPSIPKNVKDFVKNCTGLQEVFQSIFDLSYSYDRRMDLVQDYVRKRYPGQRSFVYKSIKIQQTLRGVILDLINYVSIVPVTNEPAIQLEYVTVLEILATLSVESEIISGLFQDLIQCAQV